MAIEDYFVDIEVQKVEYEDAPSGIGSKIMVVTETKTISGRIRPLNASERISAERQKTYSTHRLYTEAGNIEHITKNDRIVYRNNNYKITWISNPMNFDKFLQIELELIQ